MVFVGDMSIVDGVYKPNYIYRGATPCIISCNNGQDDVDGT